MFKATCSYKWPSQNVSNPTSPYNHKYTGRDARSRRRSSAGSAKFTEQGCKNVFTRCRVYPTVLLPTVVINKYVQ